MKFLVQQIIVLECEIKIFAPCDVQKFDLWPKMTVRLRRQNEHVGMLYCFEVIFMLFFTTPIEFALR